MRPVILLLTTKLFSLLGATLNTVGFLTFFFWESLEPYRWKMIIGGIAIIVVSELCGYLITRNMKRDVERYEESEEFDPDEESEEYDL
jgi:cellulose synthase/poly-beta-1,6-N-acetylglucosamine synthase-like glycosyltransferase